MVSGWATKISVGPANESNQFPGFFVTNDNPAIFTFYGQPLVDVHGNLFFTPLPNAHGRAHITVILKDSGDRTNEFVGAASPAVTFDIEIVKKHVLHNAIDTGNRTGLDVTGSTSAQPDGLIMSGDVLAIINYINAHGSGHILDVTNFGPPYVDMNGDGEVAADDVISIINYINAHPGQSEAEAPIASPLETNNPSSDLISLLALDIAEQAARRRRT
jgi:hypothetical protein